MPQPQPPLPPIKIDGDKLYPHLSPAERAEAAYNLSRYVGIILRIYRKKNQKNCLTETGRTASVQIQPD